LDEGITRGSIDEFFSVVKDLKEKGNHYEAGRMLVDIAKKMDDASPDERLVLRMYDQFIEEVKDLELNDYKSFFDEVEQHLEKASIIYRARENRFDKVGKINEVFVYYYEQLDKDAKVYLLDAADSYAKWVVHLLVETRAKARREEGGESKVYLNQATKLFEKANQPERIINYLIDIAKKYIEYGLEAKGEAYLDKAVEKLMDLDLPKERLALATEKVMEGYVAFIEMKITDIIDPQQPIDDPEKIAFENNVAIRIIRHARDICLQRKTINPILILAKEIGLIGLAIFTKGMYDDAIPYYELAKDYYLEVDNDEQTIAFGKNLISLGLELYNDEK
jgi:hypothetical protein